MKEEMVVGLSFLTTEKTPGSRLWAGLGIDPSIGSTHLDSPNFSPNGPFATPTSDRLLSYDSTLVIA